MLDKLLYIMPSTKELQDADQEEDPEKRWIDGMRETEATHLAQKHQLHLPLTFHGTSERLK